MTRPRTPHNPPSHLTFLPSDLIPWAGPLVRIAPTQGQHVIPFGSLRTYGPVPGCRWDPHPPGTGPAQHAPRWGVLYTSSTLIGACAETGQRSRVIDRRTGAPAVLEWTPTRTLQLLDLTPNGTWLIRNGAAASLTSIAPRYCQRWSHAIAAQAAHQVDVPVDGLLVPSVWTGHNLVLTGPSIDAFPAAPNRNVPLSDPTLLPLLTTIASTIGFAVN